MSVAAATAAVSVILTRNREERPMHPAVAQAVEKHRPQMEAVLEQARVYATEHRRSLLLLKNPWLRGLISDPEDPRQPTRIVLPIRGCQ